MATVKMYDQSKKEAGDILLDSKIFEVPVRPELLHFIVRCHLASIRSGTHSTKTRSHVSGGGAKPWRQKGTGRARAGSNRSPIWRGGAIVFGPQPRDYSFKINKKIRKLALRMALSSCFSNKKILVLNQLDIPEVKTKYAVQIMKQLDLEKPLIVIPEAIKEITFSMRNIPGVLLITPERLNVYDILNCRQLVLLKPVIESIESRLM